MPTPEVTTAKEKKRLYDQQYRQRTKSRRAILRKRWRAANPERERAIKAKYRQRNREKLRASGRAYIKVAANRERSISLLRLAKYGVSDADYQRMKDAAGGLCAICSRPFDRICIDHNHRTGRVRGLLCINCNSGIGKLRDDVGLLRKAIEYLEKYDAEGEACRNLPA